MLQKLHIDNYVLIDNLELEFENCFSVITGETGAGKSIIIGALSLLSGQRADAKMIKEGAKKCVIEASFDISSYNEFSDFFRKNNLDDDPEECIIRREVSKNGKSRAFINDTPVALSVLKSVAERLLDIHSQHQNLLLGKSRFNLYIVDSIAGNESLRKSYFDLYENYNKIKSEYEQLKTDIDKARNQEDFLRFQYNELDKIKLKEGEDEELESELALLSHAEDIKTGLSYIVNKLDDDNNGINYSLRQAVDQAVKLNKIYPGIADIFERLNSDYIDLKDIASTVESMFNNIDVDPARLEYVNSRINTLYTLQQKHNVKNTEELIFLKNKIKSQLSQIELSDEELDGKKKELDIAGSYMEKEAEQLTESRLSVFKQIERDITDMLKNLGMPKAVLLLERTGKSFEPEGTDEISFMFSSDKKIALQPVSKTASGGEISRIMLCIKAIIAKNVNLSTLIFDEIDTGVSGEIAYRMSEIMQNIAKNRQVICITHLPQIASKGEVHYKVYKKDVAGISETFVKRLAPEERIQEIAGMLSGDTVSDAAIQNAKILLNRK